MAYLLMILKYAPVNEESQGKACSISYDSDYGSLVKDKEFDNCLKAELLAFDVIATHAWLL